MVMKLAVSQRHYRVIEGRLRFKNEVFHVSWALALAKEQIREMRVLGPDQAAGDHGNMNQ